jgi:type IV pilus assembly protein PilN
MIKINLLAERKPGKVKTRSVGIQLEGVRRGSNVILVAILALGLFVAGGWWWMLQREETQWQDKLAQADVELKRLQVALKKTDEYEKQKTLLVKKITLITNLKKMQLVPVHIMDQVARNLPDFLWLDQMSAVSNKITISGKATTYTAVSNFYTNLNESGYFSDVALGRTFEAPEGVSFSLVCNFTSRSAETAVPAAAPAAPAAPSDAATPAGRTNVEG